MHIKVTFISANISFVLSAVFVRVQVTGMFSYKGRSIFF